MKSFCLRALPVMAELIAAFGHAESAQAENYLCQQQFALCTSAPCIPEPGDPKVAICSCDVEGTYSRRSRSDQLCETGFALRFQTSRRPNSVFYRSILTHLPFALEPLNGQPKPDDPPDLARDEVFRCVARRPGSSSALLMPVGELRDVLTRMYRIVDEFKRSIGVNGDVIPSWHHLSRRSFCRVPGRCDIAVWPKKNGQRVTDRTPCLWIRTS